MTTTLTDVSPSKRAPSAEAEAAQELVARAREQGLSLTGPDGLLRQFTKSVLVNRPGVSGDSVPWKGWGHVRKYVEQVPGRAA